MTQCALDHSTARTYLMTSFMLFMEAAILVFSLSNLAMDESWLSSLRAFLEDCISSILSRLRCTVACSVYEHRAW